MSLRNDTACRNTEAWMDENWAMVFNAAQGGSVPAYEAGTESGRRSRSPGSKQESNALRCVTSAAQYNGLTQLCPVPSTG